VFDVILTKGKIMVKKIKDVYVRTICVPVAECISHTKTELYAAIRKSLDASRRVSNLAASECARQDDIRDEKCKKLYTYPACHDPLLDAVPGKGAIVSALCRAVEKNYLQDRWKVQRGDRSLRNYRTMPWPLLQSQGHFKLIDDGEFLVARIRLFDGTYDVRLAGGSNYRDQIAGLRKSISIDGIGDSKLWIEKAGDKKHKAMLGISVKLPKKVEKERTGAVEVVSGIEFLVAMTIPRRQSPFVFTGEDVRIWKETSVRRNQQWRQARKQGADRKRLREQSRAFAEKMQRRLKTKVHELASQIVKKADRCKVATIEIDFTIKSYLKQFPWSDLKEKIKHKAELCGIAIFDKTQTIAEPDLDKPHIYFLYDPNAERVKIGRTKGKAGRLESYYTFVPDCVVLAIDNQPINKLVSRENHWHALFDNHRVTGRKEAGNEVFEAGYVIKWLRDRGWLGNAGNLSQIAQVLDVS